MPKDRAEINTAYATEILNCASLLLFNVSLPGQTAWFLSSVCWKTTQMTMSMTYSKTLITSTAILAGPAFLLLDGDDNATAQVTTMVENAVKYKKVGNTTST